MWLACFIIFKLSFSEHVKQTFFKMKKTGFEYVLMLVIILFRKYVTNLTYFAELNFLFLMYCGCKLYLATFIT